MPRAGIYMLMLIACKCLSDCSLVPLQAPKQAAPQPAPCRPWPSQQAVMPPQQPRAQEARAVVVPDAMQRPDQAPPAQPPAPQQV